MERIEQNHTHEITINSMDIVKQNSIIETKILLRQKGGKVTDVIELEKQSIPALIEALKKYVE